MTMISREPRQIVGFDVQFDKGVFRLQGIVDKAPEAKNYSTDGNPSYLDVIFPGKHKRNIRDKSDTHIVESINADLRHYISGLARRSRCFYRSLETLQAVLEVFVDAYSCSS
jgi:IS1 family transposase